MRRSFSTTGALCDVWAQSIGNLVSWREQQYVGSFGAASGCHGGLMDRCSFHMHMFGVLITVQIELVPAYTASGGPREDSSFAV